MKNARSNVVGVKSPEKSSVSIAFRISAIEGGRAAGSAASARRRRSASGLGTGPASPVVAVTRASASVASGSRPSGGRSVIEDSRIRPSEYTSERASPGPPWACSGEKYDAVPITEPAWVRFDSVAEFMARAIPKSATFT